MDESRFARHELTRSVIGAFFEVYHELGFGYLESVYAAVLERALHTRGHTVARECNVRVMYKGEAIGHHRLDMLVDGTVVVEIKSTAVLAPYARRQLYNYLRATNLEIGLLLHFGSEPKVYRSFVPHRAIRDGDT